MLAVVVFSAVLFWIGVFVVCFTAQGTTVAEFFLGRYEPLPPELGQWRALQRQAPPAATQRPTHWIGEERLLLPEGRTNPGHLIRQVRYRDPSTLAIVHVEPERTVQRRRVSARSS